MKEIRNIIEAYDRADHQKEKLALAAVVNIEESSYRRIGARMLVSSNGNWVGGISGGCLEGDALRRSQNAIYKNKSSRVTYDTLEEDENQIGIGLGCNGKIEVLFTPIDPTNDNNIIEQLRAIIALNAPAILLNVIECASSSPFLGLTYFSKDDLSDFDFCKLPVTSIKKSIEETRIKRRPQIIEVLNEEGASLKILIEFMRPETKLIIIGDNYDVSAMVGIVHELGWEMHVVGRRKKMLKTIFSKVKQTYEYENFHDVPMDEFSAVVLMSHDYNWDLKLLPEILKQSPPYIGMLGPRKRLEKMEKDLGRSDLNALSFFHSPVGLDIGAETPEEIALAIVAEIVSTFRGRTGNSLKYRLGAIHERNEKIDL